MKKTFILILLALMAFAPMAWAQQQFSGGTGTETDPYLISNVNDWNTLANSVNSGISTYSGQYFKMTADIGPITTMIGNSKDNSFQGTFDGNGHTLDVNLNTEELCTAPFRYVQNVTIKRLHVTGAIKTNERCSGSIVALAYGNCTFISCHSSVSIEAKSSSTHENGFHGGLVGFIQDGYFIFDNCLFDGKIKIKNFDWVGGFVGYIYQPISGNGSVVNCYFNPESCSTGKTSCARTFISRANYDDYKHYTITNSYYTHKICDPEGTNASGWSNSRLLTALGSGWHEVGGKVVPDMSIDYYSLTGDGTVASPYLIASANDWNGLARNINIMGENYKGKHFRLTQNITVAETFSGLPTTMLGVNEDLCFQGTFDGGGHTITLDYIDNRTGGGNENYYCGPFRYINGATIQNLHVDGTIIKADKKHAGGFVGKAYGDNNIINCRSSVDIQSSTNGDGSHGGFLGDLRDGTTNFKNCVFDGSLQGTNTKNWGGFVGWVADGEKAKFTNCLFKPELVNVKNDGNRTFARRDDGDDLTFNNCYYTRTLGSAQGKEACTISGTEYDNGTTVTVTPNGTAETGTDGVNNLTAYNTGSDTYNPCLKYGEVIYSASGNNVQLNLSQNGATPSGAQANSFIATPGSISGTSSPYTLAMPNTAITISLAPTDFANGHIGNVYSDPYPIYTTEQWNLLAERVNSGAYNGYNNYFFKLMADITVTTMVGDSRSHAFKGIFDGNGHTLTFTYTDNSNNDYCAPFRYINGATIKYLHVAGTIVKSKGKNAGGLVGLAEGDNTIENCRSSVDIQFNKSGDVSSGGFIGELRYGSTATLTDCLFDGKLQGTNAYKWGGFIGWVADTDGTCTANFNNCLFNPELVSIDVNDSDDNSENFARHDGDVNITNSYRKYTIKGTQGTEVPSSWSNEQLRTALGEAWEVKNNQVVPIMTLYLFSGAGNSASSPYLITSVEDWNGLVGNVYLGENYTYTYFQLTDDISVTRMVGTTNNAFKGHFDGDGNTLTFTANTSADYTAPFRYVDGADIQNLIVDGTITTSAKYAAGFIGRAGSINSSTSGSISITNCRSSITINSSVNGDGTHGGFIANIYSGTNNKITGCVFNGSLLGSNTTNCGGFVGWTRTENHSAAIEIKNSLFAPTSGENPVSSEGSYTFSRYSTGSNYVTILSSYYTQALGATNGQGRQAYSITAGEYVTMEIVGDSTEYEVSGLTLYPVGIEFNDVLYAGNADAVSLNLSSEIPEGFTFNGYNASNGGNLSGEDPYTLTMPNDNVIVTADYSIEWPGEGTEENPYRIYQPVQLDLLATRVNGTNGETQNSFSNKYFKVMNDLEYDANVADNYLTIGYDYDYPFKGHFDGQGYTISGINSIQSTYTMANPYNGLFGYLGEGAEVKDIILSNTSISDGGMAGGIAARSKGTITNCHVKDDVTINGTEQTSACHGGVVGTNEGILSHCTFAGTLTKTFSDPNPEMIIYVYSYGGIAGINSENAILSDNLVVGATIPSTMLYSGAVTGISSGNLSRNYYVGCTVAGTPNATGVGVSVRSSGYQRTDVTDNDGAVPGYLLTLDENITSDALAITVPAHGETEEVTYNVAASGNTITLGYEPSNGVVTYYVNNEALQGNTFTMPAEDVTVTADLLGISKFISGYSENTNGWNLIASPVGTVNIEDVTNMLSNTHDLYRFNQAAEREWENYKATENEQPLHSDFTTLESGRGYLYANSNDVTLLFPGTPYNGTGEVTLDYTDNNSNEDMRGWNLVGNPFAETAYIDRPFYVMNSEGNEIIAAEDANRSSITPMEGIFVKANTDGETLTFTTTEPDPEGNDKSITLNLGQGRGLSTGSRTAVVDRAIVRFGEGRQLPKFQMRDNSTKLYIPQDNADYAVVNAEAQGEMPINFKAKEDGQYTLSLGSENVAFSYLHLIDNMTGVDVDLLDVARNVSTAPSYTFTAKTTDYESRFRLVFSTNSNETGSDSFAFFSNGNWIISNDGKAILQVIDVNGRILSSETVNGSVSKAINVAPGVYVLRLINGNDVKTQKVVVK